MKISEFAGELGVTSQKVRKWCADGVLVPSFITPSGKRIFSEDQVRQIKEGEIIIPEYEESKFLSSTEFSDAIGVSVGKLKEWHRIGRLPADHINKQGHRRYAKEQVNKYFAGEYDGIVEEGYIDRQKFAQLVGVSEALVIQWNQRDLLKPDHKSVTKVWQYREEQIGEAKKLRKFLK